MKHRILALLLVLLFAVAPLSACGSGDSDSKGDAEQLLEPGCYEVYDEDGELVSYLKVTKRNLTVYDRKGAEQETSKYSFDEKSGVYTVDNDDEESFTVEKHKKELVLINEDDDEEFTLEAIDEDDIPTPSGSSSGSDSGNSGTTGGNAGDTGTTPAAPATQQPGNTGTTPADNFPSNVYVGDSFIANGLEIVYMASGPYDTSDNYSQPASGNRVVFIQVYVHNISDELHYISDYDFDAYADGYAADNFYASNTLGETLSPDRWTVGYATFEVPQSASEIEIEYSWDWSGDKVVFIYEEGANANYYPSAITTPSRNALPVGSTVDCNEFRITYLSSGRYDSTSSYVQPDPGYHFVRFEVEVENISSEDDFISNWSFDCIVDGMPVSCVYTGDNDLSASLSAGRKATGTITFQVPDSATLLELEYQFYDENWDQQYVVFSY